MCVSSPDNEDHEESDREARDLLRAGFRKGGPFEIAPRAKIGRNFMSKSGRRPGQRYGGLSVGAGARLGFGYGAETGARAFGAGLMYGAGKAKASSRFGYGYGSRLGKAKASSRIGFGLGSSLRKGQAGLDSNRWYGASSMGKSGLRLTSASKANAGKRIYERLPGYKAGAGQEDYGAGLWYGSDMAKMDYEPIEELEGKQDQFDYETNADMEGKAGQVGLGGEYLYDEDEDENDFGFNGLWSGALKGKYIPGMKPGSKFGAGQDILDTGTWFGADKGYIGDEEMYDEYIGDDDIGLDAASNFGAGAYGSVIGAGRGKIAYGARLDSKVGAGKIGAGARLMSKAGADAYGGSAAYSAVNAGGRARAKLGAGKAFYGKIAGSKFGTGQAGYGVDSGYVAGTGQDDYGADAEYGVDTGQMGYDDILEQRSSHRGRWFGYWFGIWSSKRSWS
ncbi:fibroin heavy chain-like [Stegodyphus dumicola]|uniref:fibroin heavy chain-like n=1 Tax=Stegodyphus dumicola TaxID=202533 RepID=UPI0015AB436E|nr:fibroin heavy chain-like [Stegodyphus dumicola]